MLDRDDRLTAYRQLALRQGATLTRASVLKVGEVLDADQVVFGEYFINSAAGQPASLRLTARILNLTRLSRGPEFSESGPLTDLEPLESHLAWQILQYLSPQNAPSEVEFKKREDPVRVDALENYVRGLMASNPEQKQKYLLEAIRLDARYSPPAFQLGRLAFNRADYRAAADYLARVQQGQLQFREARFLYGLAKFHIGDPVAAVRSFEMILQTVPLNEVYNNLGAAQLRRSPPAAIDSFRRAVEGDPNDPIYRFNLGYALWKHGDYSEAAENLKTALERAPEDSEAEELLDRCQQKISYRQAKTKRDGLERLKTNYEERAYWQLRAVLQPNKPQPGDVK
ncbi:MAG: tetratricopeptide repeat protein [Bryobacteraceae bacterium]